MLEYAGLKPHISEDNVNIDLLFETVTHRMPQRLKPNTSFPHSKIHISQWHLLEASHDFRLF